MRRRAEFLECAPWRWDGTARETIGREIVRLQAQYYGRGPTRARTYATGDVVVVVLEESFTPATGRRVRFFSSDTDLDNDLSIELFILADARTNMSGFEPGEDAPEA